MKKMAKKEAGETKDSGFYCPSAVDLVIKNNDNTTS